MSDPTIVVWKWEIRDPKRRSGWRLLTWMMSKENAAAWAKAEGAELRLVEGSRKEWWDVDGRYPETPGAGEPGGSRPLYSL